MDKNIFKPVFTKPFGIVFIISILVGSSILAIVYQVEISRKKNLLLYDTIENNSTTHVLIEGTIVPLNEKKIVSPFKQIPCLVYWYYKVEKYTTTDSKGKSQTSTRIVDEANDRLPFEIRTSRNDFYRIYTQIEFLKHDYFENISPVSIERDSHYELTLQEGDVVSLLIKKDFDSSQIKNEVLIYKDTKEAWLANLKKRTEIKWHFTLIGIFVLVFISISTFTYSYMRKLQLRSNQA